MKNVNLEIKRMLSLLESKMGDVRTIVEGVEPEKKSSEISFEKPEDWLDWMRNVGCLSRIGATQIDADTSYTRQQGIDALKKSGINNISVGEPFIRFDMKDKAGDLKRFNVFGKQGNGPEGSFVLIKDTGVKDPTKRYVENHLNCTERKRGESFVSDVKNLSAEQNERLEDLISNYGIKETGAELTTVRPAGREGYEFEPVDLNTGQGANNGKQYIQKIGVDGLESEFKKPGTYYVWVKLGKSVERTNVVDSVENALAQMGYTRTEPTDALAMNATPTTLGQFCKDNPELCAPYPLLGEYIDKYGGDLKIWEKDPESYKKLGSSAVGGRKSRREIKKVMNLEANKKSCQTAINTLWNCMRSNDDRSCENYIKASFGSDVPYIQVRTELEELIKKCDANSVEVSGLIGGKKYETMWSELKTSTNKFSPYAKESLKSQQGNQSLEESLSKNIRLTLKEMKLKR